MLLQTCARVEHPQSRIVWIKNTLSLEKILASEAMLPEIKAHPQLEVLGEPRAMMFDEKGNLMV